MLGLKNFNNLISICGSCRNVGKTHLGESIISHFSTNNHVVAIKISKFKHKASDKIGLHKTHETPFFTIWKQLNISQKDSGRYLKAGAKASYYIECDDEHLLNAFLFVYNSCDQNSLIVCESASITKYLNPAISIFVESVKFPTENNKLRYLKASSLVFKQNSIEISMPQLFLSVKNNKWVSKYAEKLLKYA